MEAAVILAKCPRYKITYGMRTQKMSDGDWWRTWSFSIDENRAKKEGYDETKFRGSLWYTKEYPGCPYCESKGFAQCNTCHKLMCWNGETHMTCLWCGNELSNIVTATEKFSVSGGDI